MKKSIKIAVYVPGTGDLHARVVRSVKTRVISLCGGCTTIQGEGSWVDEDGFLIEEPVTIVYGLADGDSFLLRDAAWDVALHVRTELNQKSVALEFNGTLHLV